MNFILTNLGKVGFEWKMALFNLINFFLLFLILKKFFFKSILATIESRQKIAQDAVDNAEKTKTALYMAERKAQDIIDTAKAGANMIATDAHQKSKDISEQMKKKAHEEIEQVIRQAKHNMEVDRNVMQLQLRKQTAELVVGATRKIISEKLDSKKDSKYVAEIINAM